MGLTSQLEVAGSLTALCHRPTEAQDLARVAGVSSWSRGTAWPRIRNPPLWAPWTVSPFGPSHPDSTLQVQLLEAGRPAGPTQRVRQNPGVGGTCPPRPGSATLAPSWPQPRPAPCPRGLRAKGSSAGAGEGAASAPPGSPRCSRALCRRHPGVTHSRCGLGNTGAACILLRKLERA